MSATTTTREHPMTLAEAYEYVEHADEHESESRAEYGMGAVSLGYDPGDWSTAYGGYRASDDATYVEARRIIAEAEAVCRSASGVLNVRRYYPDDLPF
jgi:hypothetical protein